MKKTTQIIAAACLTGCLSAGSLLGTGAAFADARGLSAAAAQTSEAASGTSAAQAIQATAGKPFKISLEENSSTGYAWSYKSSSNAVKLIGEKSESTTTQTNIDGAPEQKAWTFRADKPGTYTLTFVYAQPWATSDNPVQTLTYTVKVKA